MFSHISYLLVFLKQTALGITGCKEKKQQKNIQQSFEKLTYVTEDIDR